MAYVINEPRAGMQPIATTSTVKNHALGTIVRAYDPTYGEGEFIYLLGVTSTIVGILVTYGPSTYQTALTAVGVSVPQPIAVAMSANVGSAYGWYQISGMAVAAKDATVCVVAGAGLATISATGLIAKTNSLDEIEGAVCAATASAATGRTTVIISIQRPFKQGRIS